MSNFPLDSLAEECARYFGVDVGDNYVNEVGNYFAIATVFPSRKVSIYFSIHLFVLTELLSPICFQDFILIYSEILPHKCLLQH